VGAGEDRPDQERRPDQPPRLVFVDLRDQLRRRSGFLFGLEVRGLPADHAFGADRFASLRSDCFDIARLPKKPTDREKSPRISQWVVNETSVGLKKTGRLVSPAGPVEPYEA